ncbi:hypothetical protein GJ496_005839 [Pomphorhynchus laevis]|nr:hypothetical protein GJ496_005839 [Pomphorhynchus laevis]
MDTKVHNEEALQLALTTIRRSKIYLWQSISDQIAEIASPTIIHVIADVAEKGASLWLSSRSLAREGYHISAREFKDSPLGRISRVERGTFFLVTLSSSGEEGPSTSFVLKRIATLMAAKNSSDYNQTIGGIRRSISFVLARAISMCLRDPRLPHPYLLEVNRSPE